MSGWRPRRGASGAGVVMADWLRCELAARLGARLRLTEADRAAAAAARVAGLVGVQGRTYYGATAGTWARRSARWAARCAAALTDGRLGAAAAARRLAERSAFRAERAAG